LHGGEVPSAFDGGPQEWFTPNGLTGPDYVGSFYTYPNSQEATTMFFHDHALGATRLNLYAGLAGLYFLRDARDTGLTNNPIGLPAGPYEIELALQDRSFDTLGQLVFPDAGVNPADHPFWSPEFFGDVNCVNGVSWPFLKVEPRQYRFRIVNGANARFYDLTLADARTNQPPVYQIGSDGGLLNFPALLNNRRTSLLL
jgi:FtsP/CotA-like multicopper oxidase with cupredoxin domain